MIAVGNITLRAYVDYTTNRSGQARIGGIPRGTMRFPFYGKSKITTRIRPFTYGKGQKIGQGETELFLKLIPRMWLYQHIAQFWVFPSLLAILDFATTPHPLTGYDPTWGILRETSP
jgi:hypothetical protein